MLLACEPGDARGARGGGVWISWSPMGHTRLYVRITDNKHPGMQPVAYCNRLGRGGSSKVPWKGLL